MASNRNLYDSLLPDGDDFDPTMSTIGLMYDHLNLNEISKYYDLSQYNNSFETDDNKILSILHFNIRSIGKNGDEMILLLESLKGQCLLFFMSTDKFDTFIDELLCFYKQYYVSKSFQNLTPNLFNAFLLSETSASIKFPQRTINVN